MKTIWVLITGSRIVRDEDWVRNKARSLLTDLKKDYVEIRLIHGAAEGIDRIFAEVAEEFRGITVEPWPARLFSNPLIRNKFMVNLVATALRTYPEDEAVVWAFARQWASGTGNCAREARRQGLNVVDFGADTRDAKDPF